jgi:hypothetical protein
MGRPIGLNPDYFDLLEFIRREGELIRCQIVLHMFGIRGTRQGQHPDLHGESKDNLREPGPVLHRHRAHIRLREDLTIGSEE